MKSFLHKRWLWKFAVLGLMLLVGELIIGTTQAAEAAGTPDSYFIRGVPAYSQQHNLTCEYASASMITAYWGDAISESRFINAIPFSANPHYGFRGNIDGTDGGTTNYGIYAEPIADYLQNRGFQTRVMYGGVAALKSEIAAGHPVIVWITVGLESTTPIHRVILGRLTALVPGEHAAVVTGYDSSGIYVNGPATGRHLKFDWNSFLRVWNYFDDMALSIWE